MNNEIRPWPALWVLCLGFFMILVDTTIVSVATPAIMRGLDADIDSAIWVISSYLMAFAVPLLITGRLGDRFGPKTTYLLGLTLFTLASIACGLSTNIEMLIVARVFQGLGAAFMTPQTMTVITRTFSPDNRGKAMGMRGSVAGVATLVGPLLGGVLVDSLGWEWIFYVNVPVGVIGFILALKYVPTLETHSHKFDIPGVLLSLAGMFLLVFGIQEGENYDWGTITGGLSVWTLIIAGLVILAGFIAWQARNKSEPLVPLGLFKDRNFSLANIAITTVGFAVISMPLPLMLFAQTVRELSPTQSALLMVPMAVVSGALAPVVGKLIDMVNPKYVVTVGMLLFATALVWLGTILSPDVAIWKLIPAVALLGLGSAGVWAPLAATATRNLPMSQAGAGSGIYNTTRQIGSVLGSAGIAAIMQSRIAANFPGTSDGAAPDTTRAGSLPDFLHEPFTSAMGQSLYLPAAALVIGFVAVLFLAKPKPQQNDNTPAAPESKASAAVGSEAGNDTAVGTPGVAATHSVTS